MGQQEIINFLKKNKGKTYTTQEIAKRLNINLQAVYTSLRSLKNSEEIVVEKKQGKTKLVTNLYSYTSNNNPVAETYKEVRGLISSPHFRDVIRSDLVVNMMVLNELRTIRGILENGTKK
jgi:hypothetical protein